jgi:bifunctional non-homologous end joining protein LigD
VIPWTPTHSMFRAGGWSSAGTGKLGVNRKMLKAVESARAKRAPASSPSSAKAKRVLPARELSTLAKQIPFPEFIEHSVASLANETPAGDRWLHEIKWDGHRAAFAD